MPVERLRIDEPVLLIGLVFLCALIILRGRVEIATGVYCATQRWAYSVDIGPTVWVWVWVFTIIASAIVFLLRRSTPKSFRLSLDGKVPNIVVWSAFWLLWMFCLWRSFPTEYSTQLMKNLLVYDSLSFIAISLLASDLSRVKMFALTYIGATLVSGVISIPSLPELINSIQYSIFQLRGLDSVNYLAFAVPFSIATIFLLVSVSNTTGWWYRVLAIAAILFCVFCVLLTGARQSIVALGAAWAIYIFWLLRRKRLPRWFVMVAIIMTSLVIVLYSQTALVSRWLGPDANLDTLGGRIQVWQDAWIVFLRSPIWGSGFDYFGASYSAHNLWLDALAGQGIVGFTFLIGFLVIVVRFAHATGIDIGRDDLAGWRMGAFCVLIYSLVQAMVAGTIGASVSHLFWVSALIWRLSIAAKRELLANTTISSLRVPLRLLARVSTPDGYL